MVLVVVVTWLPRVETVKLKLHIRAMQGGSKNMNPLRTDMYVCVCSNYSINESNQHTRAHAQTIQIFTPRSGRLHILDTRGKKEEMIYYDIT